MSYAEHDENYYKISACLNIKDILLNNSKSKAGILGITRDKYKIALKDVCLAPDFNNSNNQKIAIIQSKELLKLVRDPYKYRYMPEIIDHYPLENINPGYAMVYIIIYKVLFSGRHFCS